MNKLLKFRVWDVVNREFTYPGNKQFLISLDGKLYDGNGCSYDEYHVIQQYTGIKDKDGREIYEGDIVKQYLYLYDDWGGFDLYGCIMYRIVEIASYGEGQTHRNVGFALYPDINNKDWSGHPITNKCEIIGNIFETPELLNKNNEPKHGKSKTSYRDS